MHHLHRESSTTGIRFLQVLLVHQVFTPLNIISTDFGTIRILHMTIRPMIACANSQISNNVQDVYTYRVMEDLRDLEPVSTCGELLVGFSFWLWRDQLFEKNRSVYKLYTIRNSICVDASLCIQVRGAWCQYPSKNRWRCLQISTLR